MSKSYALNPRWHKVIRDLWGNKTRTIIVVLSIAVGVFAIGMVAGSRVTLLRDLNDGYRATNPASAVFFTQSFDEDLIQTVGNMKEVREAEGRRIVNVRVQVRPDEWRDLRLFAIWDYNDIQVNQLLPQSGSWPPPKREVLIERASIGLLNGDVGDTILVEAPSGKRRQLRIAGLVHHLNQPPAVFSGRTYGYITFDTLEWLGEPRNFSELRIVVAENGYDRSHIRGVGEKVRDKIEKSGREVYFLWVPRPGVHPVDEILQPMLLILGVLGLLSLLLSGFLVINTISAILTQQVRQIGIMKAIGARTDQIIGIYFITVIIFCLLALFVAVPLGALGSRAFSGYMAGLINFDITTFGVPLQVLILEIAVGLIVPLLAALYPVISSARISVHQAINAYGMGRDKFGRGSFDRLLERIRLMSRPVMLSLRNTFRRKGRLFLTLATLSLGGAIFIGVFSVHASLLLTLDHVFNYWQYDVWIGFNRSYRISKIESEALAVPSVVKVESWGFKSIRRVRPDKVDSDNILIIAPPARTDLLNPTILRGRWILPEDENALVINTDLLKEESDIELGDEITLKIEERETAWRVVGIVQGTREGPIVYANYPYFARVVREVGRASSVRVVSAKHDPGSQALVAKALEEHFESVGLNVNSTETISEERSRIEYQFSILTAFLMIMAILLAVVGGLGLMGTMSINVLERIREIGVMRAIGASNRSVSRVVLVEGIVVGIISWFLGSILAIPLSKLLSDAVGIAFWESPLNFTFSTNGVLLWLAVAVILAALSSFLPARNASRLSVREVLSYE